jgi:hypothetical protein
LRPWQKQERTWEKAKRFPGYHGERRAGDLL